MKLNLKAVCSVVAFCGMVFSAGAQINLLSNDIIFRTSSNANYYTTHYGDLNLQGGSYGTTWGWLSCNRNDNIGGIFNYGDMYVSGNATFWGQGVW